MAELAVWLGRIIPLLIEAYEVYKSRGQDPEDIVHAIKRGMTVASDAQMDIEFPR